MAQFDPGVWEEEGLGKCILCLLALPQLWISTRRVSVTFKGIDEKAFWIGR